MAIGLSFDPSTQGDPSGTSGAALTPAQSAIQTLRLNLPAIAAQSRFSPLAASGPSAHSFAPETIVAQTLLRTLAGNGVPNQTLIDHLTQMLANVQQTAPTAPPAPTVSPGQTGSPQLPAPPGVSSPAVQPIRQPPIGSPISAPAVQPFRQTIGGLSAPTSAPAVQPVGAQLMPGMGISR
jgi:hypothetical protein